MSRLNIVVPSLEQLLVASLTCQSSRSSTGNFLRMSYIIDHGGCKWQAFINPSSWRSKVVKAGCGCETLASVGDGSVQSYRVTCASPFRRQNVSHRFSATAVAQKDTQRIFFHFSRRKNR